MQGRKIITTVMAVFVVFAALPAAVMAAAAVSAECAYLKTDTNLVCEVYVDTGSDQLRSGGVLLNYNTSILSSPVATKNDAVWKFTDGTTNYPYMNPDISSSGQGGFHRRHAEHHQHSAGVSGRVKVGSVTFTRNATPHQWQRCAAQAAFFGISAALGKPATYVNFVNTAGAPLDGGGVTFSAQVAERGDANADGTINVSRHIAIRSLIVHANIPHAR